MDDLKDQIKILDTYLTTCQKKDFLIEAVWVAFLYKEKNPKWDILKCFEGAIWDWLLWSDNSDKPSTLKSVSEQAKKILKKKSKMYVRNMGNNRRGQA